MDCACSMGIGSDLQEDESFQALGVELLSISPDPIDF